MNIPVKLSRLLAKQSFHLSQNSPHILFAAGTVGMVASTVLACRATLKLEGVLHDAEVEKEQALEQGAAAVLDKDKKYSEKDYKKDMGLLYIRHAQRVCRLYAPAVALGAFSIFALTKSHNILNRRNVALTAAYATVEKALDEYRDRVRKELGEEKERDVFLGMEEVERIEQTDKGKKVVRGKVPTTPGVYARFYDEFAKNWQPDPEANRIFLTNQERWANDKLQSNGYLFLNDVYDMLGLDRTKPGQFVGWTLDGSGDGYVNFHIYDAPNAAAFVNGYEASILLDFNVEGSIVDKI